MSKKLVLIILFSLISNYINSGGVDSSTQTKRMLSPQKSFEIALKYLKKGERSQAIILMRDLAEEHDPMALYYSALLLFNKGECKGEDLFQAFEYCNLAKKLGVEQAKDLFKEMVPFLMMALLEKSKEPIKLNLSELMSAVGGEQGQAGDDEDDDQDEDSSSEKKEPNKSKIPDGMYI